MIISHHIQPKLRSRTFLLDPSHRGKFCANFPITDWNLIIRHLLSEWSLLSCLYKKKVNVQDHMQICTCSCAVLKQDPRTQETGYEFAWNVQGTGLAGYKKYKKVRIIRYIPNFIYRYFTRFLPHAVTCSALRRPWECSLCRSVAPLWPSVPVRSNTADRQRISSEEKRGNKET